MGWSSTTSDRLKSSAYRKTGYTTRVGVQELWSYTLICHILQHSTHTCPLLKFSGPGVFKVVASCCYNPEGRIVVYIAGLGNTPHFYREVYSGVSQSWLRSCVVRSSPHSPYRRCRLEKPQLPCRSTMPTVVGILIVSFCIRMMHAQARRTKPHMTLLHADMSSLNGGHRPVTRASSTKYKVDAGRATAGDRAVAGVQLSKSGISPDLQWITDPWDRGVLFSVKVDAVVHDVRSKFQHVQVLETPAMGRMLVLDSALQCAERDEAGYHEFMAHVALCRRGGEPAGSGSRKSGKRALIIGGGDGGVAREILRHDDVATVDLVDIDAEVMAASKEFLPGVWRHPNSTSEAYVPLDADKRLTVRAEDGLAFLAADDGDSYDLIVVDASDPVGPGAALYSDDFYALLRRRLRPRGAVAVQGGSFWYLPMVLRTVYHGLKKAFPMVRALQCFTAVYPGGLWNVQIATLGDDPQEVDLEKADALCRRNQLLFYSPQAHRASFVLPPVALRELAKPPPSLRDTTADLEEIMAFGEESDADGRQDVALSQRWEPDVRRSLSRLVSGVSSAANAPLAAFDADGTLWNGDASEIFMEWMRTENRWNHRGDFVQRYYSMVASGNKRGAYGYVAQLFEGMEVEEARRLAKENFKLNVEQLIIPEMEELVKHLRGRGWRVVIVTASPKWIIEPGALRLGLGRDDVLGIEVETLGGKATSSLRFPLPILEGKVDVLKMLFNQGPALAVGNSLEDSYMLSYARGLALVSNPSCPELEVLARRNGWSIHHLNSR